MPGKIFYRERTNVKDGAKKPRFRVVAVSGADLRLYAEHIRFCELEHIAEALGAELILLRKGPKQQG